jgi:hypothetical protein
MTIDPYFAWVTIMHAWRATFPFRDEKFRDTKEKLLGFLCPRILMETTFDLPFYTFSLDFMKCVGLESILGISLTAGGKFS